MRNQRVFGPPHPVVAAECRWASAAKSESVMEAGRDASCVFSEKDDKLRGTVVEERE